MVGWDHQFNGHEFEQALGDGERQGNQACCGPWGRKESDTTETLHFHFIPYVIFLKFLHFLVILNNYSKVV